LAYFATFEASRGCRVILLLVLDPLFFCMILRNETLYPQYPNSTSYFLGTFFFLGVAVFIGLFDDQIHDHTTPTISKHVITHTYLGTSKRYIDNSTNIFR